MASLQKTPMIQAQGLGIAFGSQVVFQGIDLTVNAEESWVILGPSGSGKSVLLKIISGLMAPTEGTLQIESAGVGMLFQKNALFDSLSVLDNLVFPMSETNPRPPHILVEEALEWLKAVGLEHAAHLFPHEISGGMQKRLGIARALCIQPKVVLYDEPTAGLDPITARKIAELILSLKKKNKMTLITVTNEISRAFQLADHIALLARKKLVYGGTPEEVRTSKEPAIHQFIHGLQNGPLTPRGHGE